MVSQLDWLEREEQYRRRISRLFFLCTALAVVVVSVLSFMHAFRKREAATAAAQAAQEARIAAEERERALFVADSTAAVQRHEGFLSRYDAEPVPATPIFRVPVPQGYGSNQFLRIIWPKYVRVVDPEASDDKIDLWFRNYYIRAMNSGPNDPGVVLLPAIEQKSNQLSMIPPTFTQITYAQTDVGIRVFEDTLDTGFEDLSEQAGLGEAAGETAPDPPQTASESAAPETNTQATQTTSQNPTPETTEPSPPVANEPTGENESVTNDPATGGSTEPAGSAPNQAPTGESTEPTTPAPTEPAAPDTTRTP